MVITVPNSESKLIDMIKELVALPVDSFNMDKFKPMENRFYWLWRQISKNYDVNNENKFIYLSDQPEELDFELKEDDFEEELKPVAYNLQTWIGKAREEFKSKVDIFNSGMADKNIYSKHFITGNPTKQTVLRKSQGKISYFYPDVNSESLDNLLIATYDYFFVEILNSRNIRYAVDSGAVIGASLGKETSHLFVEIEKSSKIIHAYPCSKKEAYDNTKTLQRRFADELDFDIFESDNPNGLRDIKLYLPFDTLNKLCDVEV